MNVCVLIGCLWRTSALSRHSGPTAMSLVAHIDQRMSEKSQQDGAPRVWVAPCGPYIIISHIKSASSPPCERSPNIQSLWSRGASFSSIVGWTKGQLCLGQLCLGQLSAKGLVGLRSTAVHYDAQEERTPPNFTRKCSEQQTSFGFSPAPSQLKKLVALL